MVIGGHFHPDELRILHGPGGGRWTTGSGGPGLDRAVASRTAGVHVVGRSSVLDIEADLAADRPTRATADQIPDLLTRLTGARGYNLANLQVTGPGNEHCFRTHLREIARADMPQLPGTVERLAPFSAELAKAGATARLERIDPRELRMTQNQLNSAKVAAFYQSIRSSGWREDTALVASREGGILDAHHRWAGAALAAMTGPLQISVLRVDLSIDDLLEIANRVSGPRKAADL